MIYERNYMKYVDNFGDFRTWIWHLENWHIT